MLFNFGKCKCLHTGPGNTGMKYEMGGTILSKTVKEKDLGVTMNAKKKKKNLFGYTYKIYDIGYKTEMMSKECNSGDPLETPGGLYRGPPSNEKY